MISADQIIEAYHNINSVVIKTPLMLNYNLSKKYECNIFLKREDMQVVRSFKIRGAYNKMKKMGEKARSGGVICASAGNHAQGVAFACSALKTHCIIYMPTTTPNQKISKVKHFGGEWVEIRLIGDTFDDANKVALQHSVDKQMPYIHPFDDEDVIAGQGTIAKEILDEMEVPVDILIVAVGGGGLISGVGSYFKYFSPATKIIAVEAEGAPALARSMEANALVRLDKIDSFADGIAVKMVGEKTFKICKEVIDDIKLVPEGKICSSILGLYNDEAIVVEPAGAISFASLDYFIEEIKGKNVVIIVCGGNNDITRTEDIRERALLWEGRKHYFIIRFPQRAGALRDFLNLLGPNDDISHFEYTKKTNRDTGPALVGIELKSSDDYLSLIERMNESGINYEHLNNNPMLFEMFV
ncbi:MAG: threonine ammonia-lyase IlvA [Saprospiraceae bacterium]|nr:threonine ammonia-lyase IlvA [Saprospiraceae bacterium]